MSAIFISYASQDRETARAIAAGLEANGHQVWWDLAIPAGRVFDEAIQEALNAARCVVVLWSSHSVASNWVKAEADDALARGLLVPVFIERVALPIQFKRIHAADLTSWDGGDGHPEFQRLLSSIERLPARPDASTPSVAPRRAPAQRSGTRKLWLVAGVVSLVTLALIAAMFAWRGNPTRGTLSSSAGQQGSSVNPATAVTKHVPRGDLINLLAPDNGGELITAQDPMWAATVDGDENTQLWVAFYTGGKSEAVFGFKDQRSAIVEGVEILVPGTSANNVGEFELLTGNESATGRFESVGIFKPQNILLAKERYQRFMFAPRTARYVKARVLKSQAVSMSTGLNEWRLLGTLQ